MVGWCAAVAAGAVVLAVVAVAPRLVAVVMLMITVLVAKGQAGRAAVVCEEAATEGGLVLGMGCVYFVWPRAAPPRLAPRLPPRH